ncbi:MAG: hypothetical protein AAF108_06895 [Planctomycetota bacterium]
MNMIGLTTRALRAGAFGLVAGLVAGVVAGCVVVDRTRPPPRPREVSPDRLVLSVTNPVDTDADGANDAMRASVYLFDNDYDLSIASPGSMTFRLSAGERGVVYEWPFEPLAMRGRRQRSAVGDVYVFDLRMDRSVAGWLARTRPAGSVELRATFRSSGAGEPVAGVYPIAQWR